MPGTARAEPRRSEPAPGLEASSHSRAVPRRRFGSACNSFLNSGSWIELAERLIARPVSSRRASGSSGPRGDGGGESELRCQLQALGKRQGSGRPAAIPPSSSNIRRSGHSRWMGPIQSGHGKGDQGTQRFSTRGWISRDHSRRSAHRPPHMVDDPQAVAAFGFNVASAASTGMQNRRWPDAALKLSTPNLVVVVRQAGRRHLLATAPATGSRRGSPATPNRAPAG